MQVEMEEMNGYEQTERAEDKGSFDDNDEVEVSVEDEDVELNQLDNAVVGPGVVVHGV